MEADEQYKGRLALTRLGKVVGAFRQRQKVRQGFKFTAAAYQERGLGVAMARVNGLGQRIEQGSAGDGKHCIDCPEHSCAALVYLQHLRHSHGAQGGRIAAGSNT